MDLTKKYGKLGGEAVWVEVDGSQFSLLPRGCRSAHLRVMSSLTKEELLSLDEDNNENDVLGEKLFARQARMVAAHITDWKDLKMDGEDLHYSKDTARQLLIDFPEMRAVIEVELDKLAEKRVEEAEVTETVKKK